VRQDALAGLNVAAAAVLGAHRCGRLPDFIPGAYSAALDKELRLQLGDLWTGKRFRDDLLHVLKLLLLRPVVHARFVGLVFDQVDAEGRDAAGARVPLASSADAAAQLLVLRLQALGYKTVSALRAAVDRHVHSLDELAARVAERDVRGGAASFSGVPSTSGAETGAGGAAAELWRPQTRSRSGVSTLGGQHLLRPEHGSGGRRLAAHARLRTRLHLRTSPIRSHGVVRVAAARPLD
jgi:hypothetical protein